MGFAFKNFIKVSTKGLNVEKVKTKRKVDLISVRQKMSILNLTSEFAFENLLQKSVSNSIRLMISIEFKHFKVLFRVIHDLEYSLKSSKFKFVKYPVYTAYSSNMMDILNMFSLC